MYKQVSEKKRSSKEEVEKLEGGIRMPCKHFVAMNSGKVKQDGGLLLFQDCDKCFEIEEANEEVETFYQ